MLYRLLLLIVISFGIMPLLVPAQTAPPPLTNTANAQLQAKLQLGTFVEIVEANGTKEFGLVMKLDEKSVDLRTATANQNIAYNQIRSVNTLNKHKNLLSKLKNVALIPVETVVYIPLIILYLITCSVKPCA